MTSHVVDPVERSGINDSETKFALQKLVSLDRRYYGSTSLQRLKTDSGLVLYRATKDDLRCLLLVGELQDADGEARARNEYQIGGSLDEAWAVVPVAQRIGAEYVALQLQDPGGQLLSEYRAKPTERLRTVKEGLRVGVAIAVALEGLHSSGLAHYDLKPENVLLDGEGRARLLGFGLAASLGGATTSADGHDSIRGTLAYLAPERTGRTNYSIDARADLYALGVVLYELLTGNNPFQASTVAEWVHCHLARRPVPPAQNRPQIPGTVSELIMRLLEKSPDDRIHSASEVVEQLNRCLALLQPDGEEVADTDPTDISNESASLNFEDKLYGRSEQYGILNTGFQRAMADGGTGYALISGPSGVGKTYLVRAFERSLQQRNVLFAAGKSDQYLRGIPYQTLSQCFDSLIRQISTGASSDRSRWAETLDSELGENAALMLNLVPALETLIGPREETASIGPQEDQTRFRSTLRRFLSAFATGDHPLVLFLDDVQWLDAATYAFLRELAADQSIPYLFLILAYRDSDAGAEGTLAPTLDVIRSGEINSTEISLHPLDQRALTDLVSDALSRPSDVVAPLVEYVRERTEGNPYFCIQFLRSLAKRKLIHFDHARNEWNWDLAGVRETALAEDVVALMMSRVQSLSDRARRSIAVLACMGTQSERTALGYALNEQTGDVDARMAEAVDAGLVVRRDTFYEFAHDRVQEAAYAEIGEERRAEMHLRVGRRLLKSTPTERLSELAFEIATHFLKSAPLAPAQEERRSIAALFDLAGDKAKIAGAYESALKYFEAGGALLASLTDLSIEDAAFMFTAKRKFAECEFLTGKLAAAEISLQSLRTSAQSIHEHAEVAWLLITLYTAMDRSDLAIATCLDFLSEAGVPLRRYSTLEEVKGEFRHLMELIGDARIGSLAARPRLNDANHIDVLNVLTAVLPPAFFSDEKLVCMILCRMAQISVRYGNSEASPLGYAYLGMVAGPVFGDYAAGYEFGRVGLELVDHGGLARYRPRVYMTYAYHVLPWTKPLGQGRGLLRRAFEVACETGDVTYSGFSSCTLISTLLASGDPLSEVDHECAIKLSHVRSSKFGLIAEIISAQRQLVRALRGESNAPGSFNSPGFSERDFEARLAANRSLDIAACWYWIRKLQLHVYAGEFGSALTAAAYAEPLLWSTAGHLEFAEYHFFAGMARAGSVDMSDQEAALTHLPALRLHTQQLSVWYKNSPENFEARASLLLAEVARIEGRSVDAMCEYERAIKAGAQYQHLHDEALAYERAAELYASRGMSIVADLLRVESARRYAKWGARGKVAVLASRHPEVVDALSVVGREPAEVVTTLGRDLDVDAIVHSLQAVREETSLPRIVEVLMTIALEQAGAERGVLVLPTENGLRCRASALASASAVVVELRDEEVDGTSLPMSFIQAAIHRHGPIQIDDAREPNEFAREPRFASGNVRSVLCLPLVRQAEVIGLLYLENNVAAAAFSPASISLLQLLASTAAIAIENAGLDEKTVLLKEIHHRVKNNLQLISSLLSLQSSRIGDPAVSQLFAESRDRVRSMALVHENLYRAGNFVRVSMVEHLRNLCAHLVRAYRPSGQQVDLDISVDDIELDINRAISCGLIVNELVSNALKHGFVDGRPGVISVQLQSVQRNQICLRVADNGVGTERRATTVGPAGNSWQDAGIGMDLVDDLAHQLGGEVTVTAESGMAVAVCFSRVDNES